jgi:hypothetical protein
MVQGESHSEPNEEGGRTEAISIIDASSVDIIIP